MLAAIDYHRFSRQEYEQMAESGVFAPEERVELIDGLIFDMSPQSSFHAGCLVLLGDALRPLCSRERHLRIQMPLALGEDSEPEPDLALVAGNPRDYLQGHPRAALLVVEVADRSLRHDRDLKAGLYARAGIPEYWILNLQRRALEVHRQPMDRRYRSVTVLTAGDSLSPLCAPELILSVAALLP